MADASCHVNLKERPTSGETWRKEFARGIWWQYARVLIHQRAFSSKENLEISSWKGCNETTGISNKRIMEETFARLTRRLTTRPRIKLLPSVYFHDERRRIERFFRSDRSRNFLIWATRNRPRSSEKYELVPTNLNQPPWSIRIVRDNVKFSFPFWPWTIPLWFRIVQLIVGRGILDGFRVMFSRAPVSRVNILFGCNYVQVGRTVYALSTLSTTLVVSRTVNPWIVTEIPTERRRLFLRSPTWRTIISFDVY